MKQTSSFPWMAWFKILVFSTVALIYIFAAVDLLPDGITVVGYLDDAVVVLIAAWLLRTPIKDVSGDKK